ncbi:MAG: hypothetical protein HP495_13800, partial [Nitrospira sp.]|nr:hypothetical protein [Nitrospira sp.]
KREMGAEESAVNLLKELARSPQWRVVGVLGNDRSKHGREINGIKVLGALEDVGAQAHKLGVMDVIIAMPCGYSVDRTLNELRRVESLQAAWQRAQTSRSDIYLVDAGAYFSRPGPRLIDGVEILAAIFHPAQDHPLDRSQAIKLETSVLAGDSAP